MGMGGNKQKIKKILSKNDKIFCYCISDYPLEFGKIDWISAKKYDGIFRSYHGDFSTNRFFNFEKTVKDKKNIY